MIAYRSDHVAVHKRFYNAGHNYSWSRIGVFARELGLYNVRGFSDENVWALFQLYIMLIYRFSQE